MRIRKRPLQLPSRPSRAEDDDLVTATVSVSRASQGRCVAGSQNSTVTSTRVRITQYAGTDFINRDPYYNTTSDRLFSEHQGVCGPFPEHKHDVQQTTCKTHQPKQEDLQDPLVRVSLLDEQVQDIEMAEKPHNENEESMDGKCFISKLISSLRGLRRSRLTSEKLGRLEKLAESSSTIMGQLKSVAGPALIANIQALEHPHMDNVEVDGGQACSTSNQEKQLKLHEATSPQYDHKTITGINMIMDRANICNSNPISTVSTYKPSKTKENDIDVKKLIMGADKQTKAKQDVKWHQADSTVNNKDLANAVDADHADQGRTSSGARVVRSPRWRRKSRPFFRSLANDIHRRAAPFRTTDGSCPSPPAGSIPSSLSMHEAEHGKLPIPLGNSTDSGEVVAKSIGIPSMSTQKELTDADECDDDDEWQQPRGKRPKTKSYSESSKMQHDPRRAIISNQEAKRVAAAAMTWPSSSTTMVRKTPDLRHPADDDGEFVLSRKAKRASTTIHISHSADCKDCDSKVFGVGGLLILGECVLNTDPVDWQPL